MHVEAIPALKDNYIWAIHAKNDRIVIVDPGDATPVINYLKNHHLTLSALLITHHHWDHTNGIQKLKETYNVPIYGPDDIVHVTHILNNTANLSIDHINFKIITVPGHTQDHLAYYCEDKIFCGDTLFAAGCGRLFEGTAEMMFDSLQKISSLPNETKIYCAHEYTLHNLQFAKIVEPENEKIVSRINKINTIRAQTLPSLPSLLFEEKETNPFLRCHIKTVIKSAEKYANRTLNSPVEVFSVIRKWKDSF
ncbi:MAG: hydroxyacylglutathione hydrolase [Gammaproteobacteria bacterium RIFCSPHIGHO2_12_FULL_38_14]|nr:MAG: hydroxyacylglutathione hydrolase [Gammaproteobacteria bacterium RIFCSPHIGHO2_12_FULL_38_14]